MGDTSMEEALKEEKKALGCWEALEAYVCALQVALHKDLIDRATKVALTCEAMFGKPSLEDGDVEPAVLSRVKHDVDNATVGASFWSKTYAYLKCNWVENPDYHIKI